MECALSHIYLSTNLQKLADSNGCKMRVANPVTERLLAEPSVSEFVVMCY